MKIYLVGGAVRDELLGLPVKEKDWAVVGATPDKMKALGYKKVYGKAPVFIHPKTKEEYALARREIKTDKGHRGFEFDCNPNITIEEDLKRRDLTINAMAKDDKGCLIDPYGGKKDLENRVLRHVSNAFFEDPLRVLRVARFYAEFYHLGFTIHPKTLQLINRMIKSGALDELSEDRYLREENRAKMSKNPERFYGVVQGDDFRQ